MEMNCDWDREKARANYLKHGVSFLEAASVFNDPLSLVKEDVLHSEGEYRSIIIGYSDKQQLLVVFFTERGEDIRIISARLPTSNERRNYEQGE